MVEDVVRAPASPTSWLGAAALVVLVYLLGQAYRDLIDEHDGFGPLPSIRTEAPTWRRRLGIVSSDDLGDPGRFAEEAARLGPAVTLKDVAWSPTYILSPSAVASALALPSHHLSSDPVLAEQLHRVYGLSCSPATLARLLQIQRRGIASKPVTEDALRRFALSLDRQTAAFKRRRFGKQPLGKPVDFDRSLRRLVQTACLASFFGPSLPADGMRSDLATFTDAIPSLAVTPLPLQAWNLSGAAKARDALIATVVSWLETSAPEIEAIEMVNEVRAASVSTADLARMLLALIVTLTSHAPGTLSWAMLHLVQAGPDLISTLRDEASTLFWTAADEEGIDVTAATVDAGFAMPMTTDVILETVRLYTCSYIHRTVEADTILYHRPGQPPKAVGRRKLGARSVSFSDTPSRTPSPGSLSRTGSGSAMPPALKQSFPTPRPVKREPVHLKTGTRLVLCKRPAQLSEECWGSDARIWRPGRWEEDS